MPEPSADCIIAGGGIGGAVLALALGQRGHRVIIVERQTAGTSMPGRPEILARSTMDVFDRLGVLPRMLRESAMPLAGFEVWDHRDRHLLRIDRRALDQAAVQPFSTDPALTRRILMEHAEALPTVRVERGVEVREATREGGRVVGVAGRRGDEPLTWTARLTVADDGGRSRVRESLGIALPVRELPLDFLAAAGPMVPGQAAGTAQVWLHGEALQSGLFGGLFLPLPANRTALVFLLSDHAFRRYKHDPAVFYAEAARLSPRCHALSSHYWFPGAFAYVKRPFGHAERYVMDGVALLGDAAHPVTPIGGQGANMAVADAIALADVADRALREGDCSASRLAAYEQQRRPANARALEFSRRGELTLRALGLLPIAGWLLPAALSRLDHRSDLKTRLLRALASAFRAPTAQV